MKKIIFVMLCAMLMFALPIFAYAEDGEPVVDEPIISESENLPSENETATEGEISATESIVDYIKSHIEEISVIFTLLLTIFYEVRKHGKLNGSIGTLNNNAIAVAEKSSSAIDNALTKVEGIAEVVRTYKDEMASLLDEIRNSEEEKKALKVALEKVETYLNTAKLANVELANELAELLCLANIPNSKKDELYAKHIKSVNELAAAEGVISNDGEET
jgi:hypothetical protein